jgi:hypothetical protein
MALLRREAGEKIRVYSPSDSMKALGLDTQCNEMPWLSEVIQIQEQLDITVVLWDYDAKRKFEEWQQQLTSNRN